jgi:DNA-binding MarR family transcriptional regulator
MRSERRRTQFLADEAACMRALRSGGKSKSRVAVEAGLDLGRAQRALERLAAKCLVVGTAQRPGGPVLWEAADEGVEVGAQMELDVPPPPTAPKPGTTADRLLAALDRPKLSKDLADELGVTRQRVHQLVVRLLALGLVRSADPATPVRLIARAGDATRLLDRLEERVLSALPEDRATTAAKLAGRLKLGARAVGEAVERCIEDGLVERFGEIAGETLLRLTPAGAAHFQRDPSARPADPPNLPVRSDRVRSVLDHLADSGPARTTEVARELGIDRQSMNALMQYLKRRGLVVKTGQGFAPHAVTQEGQRVRDEFARRDEEVR